MKNFLNISEISIQDLKGILEQAKLMKDADWSSKRNILTKANH